MKSKKAISASCASLAVIAFASTSSSYASETVQESPVTPAPTATQDASDSNALLEDIIVTARKRGVGEAAQRTPVAISAFSERQYEAVFAQDLRDLGRLAPGVKLEGSTLVGLQNFTIRGMGISGSTPSDAPAVGVFQNGVFWGSNYGALLDTFDVESVEILRGPQGTLFGRNVTGGAVVVRTKRPGNEFGAEAQITVGNYGQKDASLAIDAPLAGDVLRGRLVGLYRSSDGFYKNLEDNSSYGGQDTRVLRGTLGYEPSSNFDATLIAEYYKSTGDSTPVIGVETPGTLPYANGFRQPDRYWDIRLDRPGASDIEVHSATLELNWDVAKGQVTSISGYRKVFNENNTDFDGTQFSGFNQAILFKSKQYSEELRYASRFGGAFEFTLGGYLFHLEHQFREGRNLNNNTTIVASGNHLTQASQALFGEFDLKLGDITVTGGARYTHEKVTAQSRPFGGCPLPATTDINRYLDLRQPCDLGPSDSTSYEDISPKLGINWKPDANNMVYASATRGFRSGGYSLRGSAITPPFDSEQVTAYEVGYKGTLLDDTIRLAASAYWNDYDGLQRTILFVSPTLGTFQKTGNAASATIKGAELDVTWQVVQDFVVTGTYGYTKAKFKSFEGLDLTGDGIPDPTLAKQLSFVRVPKHTASLSANYTVPLESGSRFDVRLAGTYQSSQYLDDLNRLKENGYAILDASLTFTTSDERWKAALFAKNLTNNAYYYYSASLGALGLVQLAGAPRQVGAQLTFTY